MAIVELFLWGKLPRKRFARQEDAPCAEILSTKAGWRLTTASRGSEVAKAVYKQDSRHAV
ncbi:hypothetical protein FF100_10165 [Methylobacterium terricola]|uniref:Uncharacterized protein n=1 Tax=Methylobacterium terricola TaxID=2583531 RepID=A0A5C4LKY6_9HYPH|nr:hypothetical protein [Methylobacterium terricola]TNC14500.1 hypothetical protein FF100_10165 [Methylobacterium terricola]